MVALTLGRHGLPQRVRVLGPVGHGLEIGDVLTWDTIAYAGPRPSAASVFAGVVRHAWGSKYGPA